MDLSGIRARLTPDMDMNGDERIDAAEIEAAAQRLAADPDFRQARDTLATFKATGRVDADFEAELVAGGQSPDSDEAVAARSDRVAQLTETVAAVDAGLQGLRELAALVRSAPEGSLPLMAPEFYARFGKLEANVRTFMMKADWFAPAGADGIPSADEVSAYADSQAKPLEDELEHIARGQTAQGKQHTPNAADDLQRDFKAKVAAVRDVAAKAKAALDEPQAGGVSLRKPVGK